MPAHDCDVDRQSDERGGENPHEVAPHIVQNLGRSSGFWVIEAPQ